jgi:hypothetical protein
VVRGGLKNNYLGACAKEEVEKTFGSLFVVVSNIFLLCDEEATRGSML